MEIKKYLPKILRDILELQYITETEDTELENIEARITQITQEVIISTASEDGISRWEKLFKITPSVSDTLDLRRFRVQSVLLNKLPYTLRWVSKRMNEIIGEGNYTVNINYEEYTLTITLSNMPIDMLTEVQKQFRNSIPANIVLLIGNEPSIPLEVDYLVGMMYGTHYLLEVEDTHV